MIDERAHRLSGIAAAPVGHAEPVADLRAVIARVDAAAADQLALLRNHECGSAVPPVRGGNELLGIGDAVRMRNTRRVHRDAFVIGETRDGLGVFALRGTQYEPLGREDRNAELALLGAGAEILF